MSSRLFNWISDGGDEISTLSRRIRQAVKSSPAGGIDGFKNGINATASEIGRDARASRLSILVLRDNEVILSGEYCRQGVEPLPQGALSGLDANALAFLGSLDEPLELHGDEKAQGPARDLSGLLFPEAERKRKSDFFVAPIRIDPSTCVLIILCRLGKRRLSSQERMLVETAAAHLALALNEAGALERPSSRGRLPGQPRLPQPATLDLKGIADSTVSQLAAALGIDRVALYRLSGNNLEKIAGHLAGAGHDEIDISSVLIHAGAAARLAGLKSAGVQIETLTGDSIDTRFGLWPEAADAKTATRTQGGTIVSVIYEGESVWGVLSAEGLERAPSGLQAALVDAAASRLELAIGHSKALEAAQEAVRREALTTRIIRLINQSNLVDETFPVLARELGDYLACDELMIASLEEGEGSWTIECQYQNGETLDRSGPFSVADFGPLIDCIKHEPLLCEDVEADQRLATMLDSQFRPAGARALMIVPVFYRGALRLAIVAMMKSGPRKWKSSEAEILGTAADQVLVALQRTELFDQISRGKQEWESTFEDLSDGIFIFDGDGRLRRVNSAAAALEGAQPADLIGTPCCELLKGISGDTCRVGAVLRTGKSVTFELLHGRLSRSLLVTVSRVKGGHVDGTAQAGAVCIVRDLSELRAAQAVAREQRGFLAKLIEHANDGIAAIAPDGKFIWFNEQTARMSGYTREELFAADSKRLLAEGEEETAKDRFRKALLGEAQTFELHAVKKNRENRLLMVTYTPIFDRGRVSSVLCIGRDITQERIAAGRAAQADKLRALGQLASGVAHNFNNVLAAIVGHAQLTRRDTTDERLLKRLGVIEQAALDGAQTVKRIQGFAAQHKDETFQTIDLNALVQDSANLTRARWADEAQANGIYYEVELELQSLPLTKGSPSELREVFVNIILNALDAMPQGGRLVMKTEAVEGTLKLSFSDTGVGMSRPISQRVFEPFFSTKGTSGMGLGLAVSYSIVERHGGLIEASSNPGRGSTFTVTIPITIAEYKGNGSSGRRMVQAADILVVDDDQPVREALVGMLISAGHRALPAAGGAEALRRLEAGPFDLMLTDLSMPGMDGLAVANEVRRRWPNIKIALVTGYVVPAKIESGHELIDAVMVKPVRLDDLISKVDELLTDQSQRGVRQTANESPLERPATST